MTRWRRVLASYSVFKVAFISEIRLKPHPERLSFSGSGAKHTQEEYLFVYFFHLSDSAPELRWELPNGLFARRRLLLLSSKSQMNNFLRPSSTM